MKLPTTNKEISRVFSNNPTSNREMIEILCGRIRYYQLKSVELKRVVDKKGNESFVPVPESHPNYKEIVDTIHWVSDFLTAKEFSYRIDTIKNQLWCCLGLEQESIFNTNSYNK